MRIPIFATLSLLLAACGGSSENSDSTSSATEEALVYLSSRGQGFNLYRNSIAGDAEVQLTDAPGWEWMAQYVPGQELLVYNSQDTAGNYQQKAMSLDGSARPFDPRGIPGVYISPQGDYIAYTRNADPYTHLRIAPLSTLADSVTIGFDSAYNGRPEWSPNQSQLLFISDESGSNELYLYTLATGDTRRLTENALREKYTSWKGDGTAIVTTMAGEQGLNDVYQISVPEGDITFLGATAVSEEEIAWSPSGRYLAYHARVDSLDDIYVWDLTADSVWALTQGQGYHGEPEWILLPTK